MLERPREALKTTFPEAAVAGEPGFELAEGVGPQRIQALLSERAHRDEARFIEYPQMSRDSGLMDPRVPDDLAHRLLTAFQRLDNTAPGAIGERLESVYMHYYVYIYSCIFDVKHSRCSQVLIGAFQQVAVDSLRMAPEAEGETVRGGRCVIARISRARWTSSPLWAAGEDSQGNSPKAVVARVMNLSGCRMRLEWSLSCDIRSQDGAGWLFRCRIRWRSAYPGVAHAHPVIFQPCPSLCSVIVRNAPASSMSLPFNLKVKLAGPTR